MATIEEAQELFSSTRISISSKAEDRFILSFQNMSFFLLESEIDDYIQAKEQIVVKPETAIFYNGYYEHLIEVPGIGSLPRRLRSESDSVQLSNQDLSLSLEISKPSTQFVLKILQSIEFRKIYRRIPPMNSDRIRAQEQDLHLRDIFRRFITIKLRTTPTSSHYSKPGKLRKIAEAGLFHLSYGTGAALYLSRSWEREYHRLTQRRDEAVQFPRRTYNSDLVSYHQLALSSDSLILGYLALYKILEHFFLSAAEAVLHKLLIEKLVLPEFSHTKRSQLRELTALIRKNDQKMDEERMLATVIKQYFTPVEIATWVKDYETESEAYYTIPQTIFGKSVTLDINPASIASSLANRIYHTRNAIVHSKEGELPRFIPFSGQENVLSKEMPIILYLAEQLILKTGEDI